MGNTDPDLYNLRRLESVSAARPIFFHRIDDRHCDRTHSSLTAVHSFDDRLSEKAASGFERIFVWSAGQKKCDEKAHRYTGRRDIAEIVLNDGVKWLVVISTLSTSVFIGQTPNSFALSLLNKEF